jgi:MFS family permease
VNWFSQLINLRPCMSEIDRHDHEHSERLPNSYWRLFTSSTISNLGDGMVVAAAPLLAISLTDDSRLIASISFAAMLPWLILSLPAGVYLDRHDRQKIMFRANLVRGLIFALIALGAATGSINIYLLIIATALAGVCELFFDMSSQAILPAIVKTESLEVANSRLYISQIISNGFIGLPFGAWIFVIAIGAPFGINAIALILAALLIQSIRINSAPKVESSTNSFGTDLKQGLTWLWKHDLLRTLAIMLGIANMCGMFAQAVFVKFARDELGLGARGYTHANAAACATFVFNDHGLTQFTAHGFCYGASHNVRQATGWERHDHGDGFGRVGSSLGHGRNLSSHVQKQTAG